MKRHKFVICEYWYIITKDDAFLYGIAASAYVPSEVSVVNVGRSWLLPAQRSTLTANDRQNVV